MYGRGYQGSGLGFGPPITPPVIKQLLIANAAVFVAQYTVPGVWKYGGVVPYEFAQERYLWQPFTYMWLHAGLGHVAMNMFTLWMFGSPLALLWGARRFLRYYLVCGIGAGLLIALVPYATVPVMGSAHLLVPTVGASGAIFAVILAYSLTWPDRTIMLIFPPIAFRAIWLIPLLFFMTVAFGGGNVSHVGHLGGVVVGWLYLRRSGQTGKLFSIERLRYRWRRYRMRQKLTAVRPEGRRRPQDRTLH